MCSASALSASCDRKLCRSLSNGEPSNRSANLPLPCHCRFQRDGPATVFLLGARSHRLVAPIACVPNQCACRTNALLCETSARSTLGAAQGCGRSSSSRGARGLAGLVLMDPQVPHWYLGIV
eukprot:2836061-Rhodomonas_salina.1